MRSGHVIAGAALVAVVAVGACTSSNPTAQPSTSPAPAASPASGSPVASAAPSASPPKYILLPNGSPMLGPDGKPLPYPSIPMPSGDQGTQQGPAPSLTHADPGLEAQLPKKLGGLTLQVESVSGGSIGSNQTFSDLARKLGVPVSSVSVASAFSDSADIQIGAVRVKGSTGAALVDAYAEVLKSAFATPVNREVQTIGSKKVTALSFQPAGTPITGYLYAKGDILFFVQAADAALAKEAIAALP